MMASCIQEMINFRANYPTLAANRLLGEPASRRREGIGEADDGSKSLISGRV